MSKLNLGRKQYRGESGSFAQEYVDKQLGKHKNAVPLDHADESVTEEKLAAEAVTEEKIADSAVTDEKIGSRTIDNPATENGTETGLLTALLNRITQAIRTQREETQMALDTKADKQTAEGGFSGGRGAEAYRGGAVGRDAMAKGGGAVGDGAKTTDGFAGGKNAETAFFDYETGDSHYIDAVQLGTGLNINPKTLQIYDHQLLDADGHIPDDRMPQLDTKVDKEEGKGLSTNDYTTAEKKKVGSIETYDITIGTTLSGHTADTVDFLCNGVNDTEKIREAFASLPEYGGKVLILGGEYNLNYATPNGYKGINIEKQNVEVYGENGKTVINRMFSHSSTNYMIYFSGKKLSLNNITLNGNKETYSNSSCRCINCINNENHVEEVIINNCIFLNIAYEPVSIFSYGSIVFTGNKLINCGSSGVCARGESDVIIKNNTFEECTGGITVAGTSKNALLENNKLNGCGIGCGSSSGSATSYPKNVILCNNIITNGTIGLSGVNTYRNANDCYITICGNVIVNDGTKDGITARSLKFITICGNAIKNAKKGILCENATNITINNNICVKGDGTESDYATDEYTIYLNNSNSCIVSNNIISGKDVADSGTSNIKENNKF